MQRLSTAAAGPTGVSCVAVSPSTGHAPICEAAPIAPAACFKNVRRGTRSFLDMRAPDWILDWRRNLSVLLSHAILNQKCLIRNH